MAARRPRGVLDDLGEEVTGIVAPVTLCMALTVLLVRALNPEGASDANAVFLASAYYEERAGDSAGTKLGGSIVNSLIFISVVALMTFVLVLLFKHGVSGRGWRGHCLVAASALPMQRRSN